VRAVGSAAHAAAPAKAYVVVFKDTVADPAAAAGQLAKAAGFQPHPTAGRYYGWLIRVGIY
jgi:hypothetical protein